MYIITQVNNFKKYPQVGQIKIDETGIWQNAVDIAVEMVIVNLMMEENKPDENKIREELLQDGDYPSRNSDGQFNGEWNVCIGVSE